jgi:hypothetical protein
MFIKTQTALAVAIVLSAGFTAASAATKHHRLAPLKAIYDVAPNNVSVSSECRSSDSPCRTEPDSW